MNKLCCYSETIKYINQHFITRNISSLFTIHQVYVYMYIYVRLYIHLIVVLLRTTKIIYIIHRQNNGTSAKHEKFNFLKSLVWSIARTPFDAMNAISISFSEISRKYVTSTGLTKIFLEMKFHFFKHSLCYKQTIKKLRKRKPNFVYCPRFS